MVKFPIAILLVLIVSFAAAYLLLVGVQILVFSHDSYSAFFSFLIAVLFMCFNVVLIGASMMRIGEKEKK